MALSGLPATLIDLSHAPLCVCVRVS